MGTGFGRAYAKDDTKAIKFLTVFAGNDGCDTITFGNVTFSETGAK